MNMNGILSLGGHTAYVWGAVAVCLGVMAVEVAALCSRSRAAQRAMGEAAADPRRPAQPEGGAA